DVRRILVVFNKGTSGVIGKGQPSPTRCIGRDRLAAPDIREVIRLAASVRRRGRKRGSADVAGRVVRIANVQSVVELGNKCYASLHLGLEGVIGREIPGAGLAGDDHVGILVYRDAIAGVGGSATQIGAAL